MKKVMMSIVALAVVWTAISLIPSNKRNAYRGAFDGAVFAAAAPNNSVIQVMTDYNKKMVDAFTPNVDDTITITSAASKTYATKTTGGRPWVYFVVRSQTTGTCYIRVGQVQYSSATNRSRYPQVPADASGVFGHALYDGAFVNISTCY